MIDSDMNTRRIVRFAKLLNMWERFGWLQGRRNIILKQLAWRFGSLPDTIEACLRNTRDAELDAVAERLLTAQTLDQVLGPLHEIQGFIYVSRPDDANADDLSH
jgi:uncharacterized protein DUF4351